MSLFMDSEESISIRLCFLWVTFRILFELVFFRYFGYALWDGLNLRVEEVAKSGKMIEYYATGPLNFLMLHGGTGVKHLFLQQNVFARVRLLVQGKTIFFIRLNGNCKGLRGWFDGATGNGHWSDPRKRSAVHGMYYWLHRHLEEACTEAGVVSVRNDILLDYDKRENVAMRLDADAVLGAVVVDISHPRNCACHRVLSHDEREGHCFEILERVKFDFTLRYEKSESWERNKPHYRTVGFDYFLRLIRVAATQCATGKIKKMMCMVDL